MIGVWVVDEVWVEVVMQLDDYLWMNIEVVDVQGKFFGEGCDLVEFIVCFVEVSQVVLVIFQVDKEQQCLVEVKVFVSVVEKVQQKVVGLLMMVYLVLVEEQGEVKEGCFLIQVEVDY